MQKEFFTRNRVLSFNKIILFIINLAKKTLQLELYDFAAMSDTKEVTKQAFSKARRKLNPVVFEKLNEKLVQEFYTDNEFKTFNGYRVLLIDGTKIQLPSSPELIAEYGRSGNLSHKGLPMAQASILFDALNKITIDSIISQYNTSEEQQALKLLNGLLSLKQEIPDLLIFDRGYPSIHLIMQLVENKKDFLMRCQWNFIKEVREIANKGEVDQIINLDLEQLSITTKRILFRKMPFLKKNKPVPLRLVSLQLKSGEYEILLTTLLDKKHTPKDLFFLYKKRWNIEENYKFIKSIAAVENFSGKSKITVEQDFYATVFTCNVASLFIEEVEDEVNLACKKKKLKHKYKVNRNITLGILKNKLIECLLSNSSLDEFCDHVKYKMKKSLIPIRDERLFSRIKSKARNYATNRRSCM